jgi:hypothetical protein
MEGNKNEKCDKDYIIQTVNENCKMNKKDLMGLQTFLNIYKNLLEFALQ